MKKIRILPAVAFSLLLCSLPATAKDKSPQKVKDLPVKEQIALAQGAAPVLAAAFPAGLVYTRDTTGRWAGKEGSHAPKVTVEGGKVTFETPHPMSAPHFIGMISRTVLLNMSVGSIPA